MISFIVPAYNEGAWIGRCVSAIRSALESLNEPHEIIVVDDAPIDATAPIARQQGAQVIRVEHRQIVLASEGGSHLQTEINTHRPSIKEARVVCGISRINPFKQLIFIRFHVAIRKNQVETEG